MPPRAKHQTERKRMREVMVTAKMILLRLLRFATPKDSPMHTFLPSAQLSPARPACQGDAHAKVAIHLACVGFSSSLNHLSAGASKCRRSFRR